jgi:PBP1b-binding outer membrane lipoprotein LpoB
MKNLFSLLFLISVLSGCFQTPVKPENVEHPIMQTLKNYFEGRRNADIDLLKSAFVENASLETVDANGIYMPISMEDYLQTVSAKGKVEVETQVMYLSITNNIAIAQTRFDYSEDIYMDYLTLIKTAKGWKISNKAFVKM